MTDDSQPVDNPVDRFAGKIEWGEPGLLHWHPASETYERCAACMVAGKAFVVHDAGCRWGVGEPGPTCPACAACEYLLRPHMKAMRERLEREQAAVEVGLDVSHDGSADYVVRLPFDKGGTIHSPRLVDAVETERIGGPADLGPVTVGRRWWEALPGPIVSWEPPAEVMEARERVRAYVTDIERHYSSGSPPDGVADYAKGAPGPDSAPLHIADLRLLAGMPPPPKTED